MLVKIYKMNVICNSSTTSLGKGEDVSLDDDMLENVSKTGRLANYAVFSRMFMLLLGRAVPPEGVDVRTT
jgi:hypothetical protein